MRRPALLAVLVGLKVVQEIAIHGFQILDCYNLSEVVDRLLGLS